MTQEQVLAEFGVAESAEGVWRQLVETPNASLTELDTAAKLAGGDAETALETLENVRLVHRAETPSGYMAYEPGLAVQALVADAQREVAERSRRLAVVQATIAPLSDRYALGRISAGIDPGLEVLRSLEEIREHIALASKKARVEIRAILKGATAGGAHDARVRDPDLYRRGLVQRSIVDIADLADSEFYAALAENSREGDQIRSMVDAPTQMLMYDNDLAVLPIDIKRPTAGAMLIRERALIDTLIHMFEHYWREANPVYVSALDAGLATKRQIQVLELMAGGSTDAAISRAINVGVRTIRREVAELRGLLGVTSRTEIVAAAIRRGWL